MIDINQAKLQRFLTEKSPQLFEQAQKIASEPLPPLMFAAIDNDLLPKVELIKYYVLKIGKIPIVGESALGTYLASIHHKGRKEFILRDCLSLIDLCDEFTIFVDSQASNPLQIIAELADGVFYEAAYWFKTGKKHINIINIHDFFSAESFSLDERIFDNLNLEFKKEIYEKLNLHSKQKLPTTYALMPENHAKYSDWIRQDLYRNHEVPVIPHVLLSTGSMILAKGDDPINRLITRVAIAARSKRICLYGAYQGKDLSFKHFSLNILLELYLIVQFNPVKHFEFKNYSKLGIPKYKQPRVWALTTKESKETIAEQGVSRCFSSLSYFLKPQPVQPKSAYSKTFHISKL